MKDEYIKKFWVGLMDGCGDIQVNKSGKNKLQFRLIIILDNNKSNYFMLIKIIKTIGGKLQKINSTIMWLVDNKEEVNDIIKIYNTYPPLSTKKICQLSFLKKCLKEKSVETYLFHRKHKYDKQLEIINFNNSNFKIPNYFSEWLSGFIEIKGQFLIKDKNICSFLLKQDQDIYIINLIKQYFYIKKNAKDFSNLSIIETYNKEYLLRIINHCINYPLIGQNLNLLKKFSKKLV